jgi:hypothetical protein
MIREMAQRQVEQAQKQRSRLILPGDRSFHA